MPKVTVTLPDQLWQEVRLARPTLKASQLIEAALQCYLAERTVRPSFARERPEGADASVRRLQARLIEDARSQYEAGFAAGLARAEGLPWHALELAAIVDWSFGRWLDRMADDRALWEQEVELTEALLGTTPDGHRARPGSAWQLGFMDALHDLWAGVAGAKSPDGTGPVVRSTGLDALPATQ